MNPTHLSGYAYMPLPKGYGPELAFPPRWIVIHKTDNTASAMAEAHYSATRTDKSPTSAHFIVDRTMVVGQVPLDQQAWAARFNGNRLGWQIEICGKSLSSDFDVTELRHAALLVARLCLLARIPVAFGTPQHSGIVGHGNITEWFPQDHGTHTDPDWTRAEWAEFLAMVHAAYDSLTAVYVTVRKYAQPVTWDMTLGGIARKYNTTVQRLLALNSFIHDPNVIIDGQKIRVE